MPIDYGFSNTPEGVRSLVKRGQDSILDKILVVTRPQAVEMPQTVFFLGIG